MTGPPRARLDGIDGTGYAVVESLDALGKGRRCTGVFRAPAGRAGGLETLASEGRWVTFEGTVHDRHGSEERTLEVRVTRILPDEGAAVEFTARWEATGARTPR